MDIKRGINNMNKNMIKLEEASYNYFAKNSYVNANNISAILIGERHIYFEFSDNGCDYIFLIFPVCRRWSVPKTEYNIEQLRKAGLID